MINQHLIRRLGALLVTASIACATIAFDEKVISVCNTTGITVSDLHVTFSGSGGNVSVAPASVFAGFCPVPAVPSNGAVTNTVVIDWGMPCVPPGAWVTFTVRTTNGPLGMVSGNWTLGGANVGPVWPGCFTIFTPPPPPPPPPPRPFWAKKWQRKCIPHGRIQRTPWMGLPGTPCWVRWVCIPAYSVYARKARCYYISRNGRLIETARCIGITRWKRVAYRPARYKWQRTTLRPPDLNDPGNIPPIGPPKNTPRGGWEWGWKLPYMMSVNYSDDSGATERIGDDMIASFFDVFHQLTVEDIGTPSYPLFPQVLQVMGPRIRAGGQRISQMMPEFNAVLSAEPTASCGLIRPSLNTMGSVMQAIGSDMSDGTVNSPTLFLQWENALTQLASQLPGLDPADQRWQHAQQVVLRMRDGIHVSFQQATLGLVNQTQQDYFLWGIQNRFTPEMHCLAHAVSPHVEIDLDLGPHGWEPSELDGARVMILDPLTGEILDQSTLPVSTNGKVFVPTIGYENYSQLDIRVKFDTFLGWRGTVPIMTTPSPVFVTLQNGDVNADEIVDGRDLTAVNEAMGQGGPTAPEVPPADLNNDGIVDAQDMNLVLSNMGHTGQAFYEMRGIVHLQDYVAPIETEMLQLSLSGSPFPREVLLAEDGEYSIAVPVAGLYTLNLKGRTWLSQSRDVFFGPGSQPFEGWSFKNGDVDGDNEVGPNDFARLTAAFGSMAGDSFFDIFCDLDGDGEVGPNDFSVLSTNFGETGS